MKNDILNQYKGFINTPNLWNTNLVFDLEQFEMPNAFFHMENLKRYNEIRLGKRVEQFFNFQIENSEDCKLLVSNLQIKDKKITIGELDAIILKDNKPIHVEIVYKFYLYDPNIKTNNPLDYWIGPNRKDTLIYKLNKLKEKQLPLLYSEHSKRDLKKLQLNIKDIRQEVCYKAQLFLPFQSENITLAPLSKNSVYGLYMPFSNLEIFKNSEFYIPKKLDWLLEPNLKVNWINFENASNQIETYITKKRSPMVWMKNNNRDIQKCFITFW